MRRPAIVLSLVSAVATAAPPPALAQEPEARTLLAVFAHPDDETVVAPMLARYAREGVKVVLAIATDGQKGVREHAGIAAGAPLAEARAAEARCACEKLGIEPPVLIGLEDGALNRGENGAALLEALEKLFADLQPDVVVTWGPDGVTGHPDHRLVSAHVTEVYQRRERAKPRHLYYVGLSATGMERLAASGAAPPMPARTVSDHYLPLRVAYTEADATSASRALACHESQYTPEERAALGGMARAVEGGAIALRPWFVKSAPATDLFAPAGSEP
jgi:LmbE family N-acetylglucosaminyl deacetylase